MAGRQTHDNVMVALEVFHHLRVKKKGKKCEMALNVDMNMTYDRVEWGFLKAVLEKLGFDKCGLNGLWKVLSHCLILW